MKYGLIGKDVSTSLSKKIHEMLCDSSYELLSFSNDNEVLEFFKTDFDFVNITIPYKILAFQQMDELSPYAKATGVVNLVVKRNGKLYGFNTDVCGFYYLLDKYSVDVKDKDCLILGTGATSKSVEFALKERGAKSIKFLSRTPNGENEFSYQGYKVNEEAQIIVNTTPVGMNGLDERKLIDFNNCKNAEYFLDVVYKPFKTRMVLDARDYGIKSYGGLPMLVAQAIKSHELYFGTKIEKERYDEIYRKMVISSINLVLIGHPFAGKSTICEAFAKKYHFPSIDIDKEIVRHEDGTPISQVFLDKGETYFRNVESSFIEECSNLVGYVIAMGGGAVLSKRNRDLFAKNSLVFNIKRPLDLIDESSIQDRPLARSKRELGLLIENRKDIYERYQDFEIINDGDIEKACDDIWRSL